jgi:hypothetical protein
MPRAARIVFSSIKGESKGSGLNIQQMIIFGEC